MGSLGSGKLPERRGRGGEKNLQASDVTTPWTAGVVCTWPPTVAILERGCRRNSAPLVVGKELGRDVANDVLQPCRVKRQLRPLNDLLYRSGHELV
mmetsp:Transcript_3857/g.11512  ORF Transcript_3857/g.11512 Transcript_3857/m.11512 type:complete len:96 (+) Transcript_3857:2465-2752(+)